MIIGASGVLSTPPAQLPRCSRRTRRNFPVKAAQNKVKLLKVTLKPYALFQQRLSAHYWAGSPQNTLH